MTYEQLQEQEKSIKSKIDALYKEIDTLEKKEHNIEKKYIEDNKPFDVDCFVEITTLTKSGRKIHNIGFLKRWMLSDGKLYPCAEKVKPCDKKDDDWSETKHYYISDEPISYWNKDFVSVKQIKPLPMLTCDTCTWLRKANDGNFRCEIIIDLEPREEGCRACQYYSYWTWSNSEGGITHRQSLIKNGNTCKGEQQARQVFGNILSEAAKRGHL